ncbi:MAG: transposase [Planctomycetota bacterium]|jgi:putative transposase
MSRRKRKNLGGIVYHVLNRANGRLRIFKKSGDFSAFEKILAEGLMRFPMRLLGYCLMGNHWHLLLWPREDGDLSTFMQWVTMTHSQRWHAAHGTAGMGHLYQGRFKSFPVQSSEYYLTVLRYIESNPLRAELVDSSADWQWSSLAIRQGEEKDGLTLTNGPLALPESWLGLVDIIPSENDLEKLDNCIQRGCPYGSDVWVERTANRLELQSTLRSRGRPKKKAPDPF